MTTPANKTLQDRTKQPTVSGRKSGKRLPLREYKLQQRAALDALRKAAGG